MKSTNSHSKLYPHQRDAVNKLSTGSVLCGGVGSGKSLTALAYFFEKVCGGRISEDGTLGKPTKPRDLYIITTARKRDTLDWEHEGLPLLLSPKMDVWGISVHIDSWNNIKKYTKINSAFFIFDEQRVVGSGAWVKSFLKIARKNQWILLSATPGDTWMDYVPIFIAHGFYKNRSEFIREHVVYNRFAKFPKIDRFVETKKLEVLRSKILVNMPFQRVTARHYEQVIVGYDEELYKQAMETRWNIFEEKPMKNISEACSVFRKIIYQDPSRLDSLKHIFENHPKLIVFYNFNYELEMLRAFCAEANVNFAEWNGFKHESIPKSDSWIYLVQYTAGAEGWNCVETDTMVFYSLNYSYKIMEQAAGRIDRLNTRFKDLYYYQLLSKAPIDNAVLRSVKRKTIFNERAFAQHLAIGDKT